MVIRKLDAVTVARICAGEVVESPRSVLKELLENALDAGGRRIEVALEGGGRDLIRVSDDGCGIAADDLPRCVERYSTSKLERYEQLENLRSYGFRGEALAAVAGVAAVQIGSQGVQLRVDHGVVGAMESAPRSQGTSVEVRDLFGQVPARRKFLRSPHQCLIEARKQLVQLALAAPQVGFKLLHEGKLLLETSCWSDLTPEAALRMRLAELLGESWLNEAIRVDGTSQLGRLHGYVGPVSLHSPTRIHQHLFVNQRAIHCPMLHQAVGLGYGYRLPEGRFSHCVLFCDMAPGQVDINVHPQKREVQFFDPQTVRSWVTSSVDRALEQGYAAAKPQFVPMAGPVGHWEMAAPPIQMESLQQLSLCEVQPSLQVWTVAGPYAWVQIDQTVTVVDLRAAYGRVLFEALGAKEGAQGLLLPVLVEVGKLRMDRALTHLQAMEAMGFSMRPMGETSLMVEAVPSAWRGSDVGAWVTDLLDQLEELDLAPAICRAALKAPPRWSLTDAQCLVEQLLRSSNSALSPFGTPTMIRLTPDQIARFFR
jgi:DNA mismatch repair protein MutL